MVNELRSYFTREVHFYKETGAIVKDRFYYCFFFLKTLLLNVENISPTVQRSWIHFLPMIVYSLFINFHEYKEFWDLFLSFFLRMGSDYD